MTKYLVLVDVTFDGGGILKGVDEKEAQIVERSTDSLNGSM